MDCNGDGDISRSECQQRGVAAADIDDLFALGDADHDGLISLVEFQALAATLDEIKQLRAELGVGGESSTPDTLPDGWSAQVDPASGLTYYSRGDEVTWTKPGETPRDVFYASTSNERCGPVNQVELGQAYVAGEITKKSLVWWSGIEGNEWVPLDSPVPRARFGAEFYAGLAKDGSDSDDSPEDAEGDSTPVVIDVGSVSMRYGLAGEDEPHEVGPALFARAKRADNGRPWEDATTMHIGTSAETASDVTVIGLSRTERAVTPLPILDRGVVQDWDAMEKVFREAFVGTGRLDENGDSPRARVFLAEPILAPKAQRERLAIIIFETFHAAALHCFSSAALALFGVGASTGTAVMCEAKSFSAVVRTPRPLCACCVMLTPAALWQPVYESYPLAHAVKTASQADALSLAAPTLLSAITAVDDDARQEMLRLVVLAGEADATAFADEQLPKAGKSLLELEGVSSVDSLERLMPIPPERAGVVWEGGSMVAGASGLAWFTREGYEESGPEAAQRYSPA